MQGGGQGQGRRNGSGRRESHGAEQEGSAEYGLTWGMEEEGKPREPFVWFEYVPSKACVGNSIPMAIGLGTER